jgi:hypothetical protein
MKKTILKFLIYFSLLLSGFMTGLYYKDNIILRLKQDKESDREYIKFDDTGKNEWEAYFKLVSISSSVDGQIQKAYFYPAKSDVPKPLVVSLHTWSGDYSQKDELADLCRKKDINYIHPDFRGINNSKDACCSELALSDIDDAISYALSNSYADSSKIYVIGVSGGGYATLGTFMKSKHEIDKFSAWASISDLIAWYNESLIRKNRYSDNILNCTGSGEELNESKTRKKSPIYWETPVEKLSGSKLFIYAGIYDGIQGSVPITHSINFYNKLLSDLNIQDASLYVTDKEKLDLLEFRRPLGSYGTISGREVCLIKECENIRLTIFTGGHEMLTGYAFEELLAD